MSSGSSRYPLASAPAMYNSPGSPSGTGCNCSSSTNAWTCGNGVPKDGAASAAESADRLPVASTTCVSVGPYWLYSAGPSGEEHQARRSAPGCKASPAWTRTLTLGFPLRAYSRASAFNTTFVANSTSTPWESRKRASADMSWRCSSATTTRACRPATAVRSSCMDTSNWSGA